MRTQLLPHNKIAYKKVIEAFKTTNRTCVVHPTGTGKSFLTAAVCEGFENILILAPNIFVLDQVRSVLAWRKKGIEYMTYSLLMCKENTPTGYDLICLDEFHRAGAPEWGGAVDGLLDANPNAKVLGTTATPIRFLDDNRNMADELFKGNIASYMSLGDAWNRHILPVPRFVTGLFEFDKVAADVEEKILRSHRIDEKEKKVRLTRVNNLRLDWERSQGMPQIIRKHIDKDSKRIIVFCGNVEKLKEMEKTVREWFLRAGFKVADVYNVHAYMTDRELKDAMDSFERDDNKGVKLMLSVNMLNEGVHIPRVNAVILLRTTSSKIIYLQQIGRCLTAANTDKPIVLDMVDNITTTNIVHEIKENFNWYEHQKLTEEKEYSFKPSSFVVYDYTLGIQDVINKLLPHDSDKVPFTKRLARLIDFVKKHDRLPSRSKDGIEEANNLSQLRRLNQIADNSELNAIFLKYNMYPTDEQLKQRILDFYAEHGTLPVKGRSKYENNLYKALRLRKSIHDDPEIKKLLETRRKQLSLDERIELLQRYIEENGRRPLTDDTHMYGIWIRTVTKEFAKGNPKIKELYDKYGGRETSRMTEYISPLADYIHKYHRLPSTTKSKEEYHLYAILVNLRMRYADHPEVKPLLEEIEALPTRAQKKQDLNDEITKREIIGFVEKYHRLPSPSGDKKEVELYKNWKFRRNRLRKDPQLQAICDMYDRKVKSFEERYEEVRDWAAEHGRIPKRRDGSIFQKYDTLRRGYYNTPEFQALRKKYNIKESKAKIDISARLDKIEAFVKENGRLPSIAHSSEGQLGNWWIRLKSRYSNEPRVAALIEQYPIQNRTL